MAAWLQDHCHVSFKAILHCALITLQSSGHSLSITFLVLTKPTHGSESYIGVRALADGSLKHSNVNCTAVQLYCNTTVLLYNCTAVQVYCCKSVLLYNCTAVQVYYCTAVKLYCCTSVQLYRCITVQMYNSRAVQLNCTL